MPCCLPELGYHALMVVGRLALDWQQMGGSWQMVLGWGWWWWWCLLEVDELMQGVIGHVAGQVDIDRDR